MEPVAGNMGLVLPQPGFLEGLRELTAAHGALLVFDEVMTGFRVHPGGAQALYGITPDLTTLGKVIGGGLPVGAYGGRREIMELVAPAGPVYQAGTLSGNPLAMTAGIETLRVLAEPGVWDGLERVGGAVSRQVCRSLERSCRSRATGSMFGFFFADEPVTSWETARTADTRRVCRVPSRDARARRLPCAVAVRGRVRVDRARRRRDRRDGRGGRATRSRARLATGLRFAAVKVLLVTMYFPPAGGGGVQRSLKLAQYLPALGIETHVLAPDDPKWVHRDPELRVPTQAWIHRVRYVGPRARKPAEELRAADGLDACARAGAGHGAPSAPARRERDVEPDRDPGGDPDRASARASTP